MAWTMLKHFLMRCQHLKLGSLRKIQISNFSLKIRNFGNTEPTFIPRLETKDGHPLGTGLFSSSRQSPCLLHTGGQWQIPGREMVWWKRWLASWEVEQIRGMRVEAWRPVGKPLAMIQEGKNKNLTRVWWQQKGRQGAETRWEVRLPREPPFWESSLSTHLGCLCRPPPDPHPQAAGREAAGAAGPGQ